MPDARCAARRWPLVEAALISVFILGLFYYWYALADRYVVFLYGHVASPGDPQAQPFDEMTASRYWVCGLVACGAVLILYAVANWVLAQQAHRRGKRFVPSTWWRVWVLSAIPLGIGIPAITMSVNAPTLPPGLAVACVVATWSGLAIALPPGEWAAERPQELLRLAADGLGLVPPLLCLRAVELPSRGVSLDMPTAWLWALGSVLGGLIWLTGMSLLRLWRHWEMPSATALFLAGVAWSYVLLPLVHHVLATPPHYRYISAASNFFAFDPRLQVLVIAIAAGLALGVTAIRRRWVRSQ
ncbi:MAG: hypothetical protein ACP5R2_09355 [Anaerolineae bacterium]